MESIDSTFIVEYGDNGGGDIVVEIIKKSERRESQKDRKRINQNGKYFLTSGHRTFGLNKIYICELLK
jgi:hypothetical protein